MLAVAAGIWWVQAAMVSGVCELPAPVDLDMASIIALKNKHRAYARDPTGGAALELTEREVNFLLQDMPQLSARVRLSGNRLVARVVNPTNRGCYDLTFAGVVRAHQGKLVIVPDDLQVGSLDLTWLVGGTTLERSPSQVSDQLLAQRVANLESMEVVNGRVHIRMIDPLLARW